MIAATAVVGIAVVSVLSFGNPLRRDAQTIRESFLRDRPVGTSLAQVKQWLVSEKRLAPQVNATGFVKRDTPKGTIVGVRSIQVTLGEYRTFLLLKTCVEVFWGFNEREELVDVWVWKTTDGP
jgi:hypothetical protein